MGGTILCRGCRAQRRRTDLVVFGYKVMAGIWRYFPERLRWWILWLVNPKMVVGVSGVLLNEANEVLLLKHRFHPCNPWGLPGGWIERGERVDEAWLREIREETQLQARVEGIVVQRSTPLTLEFILVGRIIGGQLVHDQREILEARFFKPDALPQGIHADHVDAIRRACTATPDLVKLPVIRRQDLAQEPIV
jgi:8-oxo-dGTP diphosphatase